MLIHRRTGITFAMKGHFLNRPRRDLSTLLLKTDQNYLFIKCILENIYICAWYNRLVFFFFFFQH